MTAYTLIVSGDLCGTGEMHRLQPTLKSWTPMQANMKFSSMVTKTMLPMVLMATNTHWTTCYQHTDETQLITLEVTKDQKKKKSF